MSECHPVQSPCTAFETRLDAILPTLATKADVGEIRADLHKMIGELRVGTLATMLTIVATMLTAVFVISQISQQTTPATLAVLPATIIIIVPASRNHP